jgi:hypothetical protein
MIRIRANIMLALSATLASAAAHSGAGRNGRVGE